MYEEIKKKKRERKIRMNGCMQKKINKRRYDRKKCKISKKTKKKERREE